MLDLKVKSLFFDRPKVIAAMDRANRAALSKAGAFVRQAAKTSIRPRKGISAPGSAPFSHEGSLRRLILFGYDPTRQSVVVGSAKFKKGKAPSLLEFGGKAASTNLRFRNRRRQVQVYRPRPYMGPALSKTAPTLPRHWANSVRGG